MKFVSVREVKAKLSEFLEASQNEGVIVTNHGKPSAVILGVAGYDPEDVMLMASPKFWKMIEESRRQPRTSLEDFEKELVAAERKPHYEVGVPKRKPKRRKR